MKKLLVAGLLLSLSLFTAMSVSAYTISIPGGVGGMPTYGGEYVGPIGAQLDGAIIKNGITCVDFNSTTYVPNSGFSVTVETLSPVSLLNARFQSADTLLKYQEAAWLNTQIHMTANQSKIGEIQYAMWEIFLPADAKKKLSDAEQGNVSNWLKMAGLIDFSMYDFSSVRIYTPLKGDTNQEFISGDIAPVPEPGTLVLLGAGMFGLVIYGKRRMGKDS